MLKWLKKRIQDNRMEKLKKQGDIFFMRSLALGDGSTLGSLPIEEVERLGESLGIDVRDIYTCTPSGALYKNYIDKKRRNVNG